MNQEFIAILGNDGKDRLYAEFDEKLFDGVPDTPVHGWAKIIETEDKTIAHKEFQAPSGCDIYCASV